MKLIVYGSLILWFLFGSGRLCLNVLLFLMCIYMTTRTTLTLNPCHQLCTYMGPHGSGSSSVRPHMCTCFCAGSALCSAHPAQGMGSQCSLRPPGSHTNDQELGSPVCGPLIAVIASDWLAQ